MRRCCRSRGGALTKPYPVPLHYPIVTAVDGDLMVQETIIGDLRKNDFELVSVTEPDLLQDDPSRKLMRQIFGAIAEYEKTMIVLKLRGARARRRLKDGRCEGRKPFGYYEGEQATIDRMRVLRRSGMAFDKIAAQ